MIINLTYSLLVHIIYAPIDWVSVLSYALSIGAYLLTFLTHFFCRWVFLNIKKKNLENRIMEGLIDNKPNEVASMESNSKGNIGNEN